MLLEGVFSAIPFAPQINVVPALLQPRYPLGKLPHSNVDSVGYGEGIAVRMEVEVPLIPAPSPRLAALIPSPN